MPRVTALGAKVMFDRPAAVETILTAVRAEKGNVVHAARALGVPHRSLCRWIGKLGIWDEIDAIRTELGLQPMTPMS